MQLLLDASFAPSVSFLRHLLYRSAVVVQYTFHGGPDGEMNELKSAQTFGMVGAACKKEVLHTVPVCVYVFLKRHARGSGQRHLEVSQASSATKKVIDKTDEAMSGFRDCQLGDVAPAGANGVKPRKGTVSAGKHEMGVAVKELSRFLRDEFVDHEDKDCSRFPPNAHPQARVIDRLRVQSRVKWVVELPLPDAGEYKLVDLMSKLRRKTKEWEVCCLHDDVTRVASVRTRFVEDLTTSVSGFVRSMAR